MPGHRNLRHPQTQHVGAHLHFDRPAKGTVLHVQRIEGAAADRPVRPEIGGRHAPDRSHQQASQAVAETLGGGHGTGLDGLPNPDDQVGAMRHAGQHRARFMRACRTITVHEQQHVAVAGANRFPTRHAIAGLRHVDDARTRRACDRRRAVARPVVGHHHLQQHRLTVHGTLCQQASHHGSNTKRLVAGRNDGAHAAQLRPCNGSHGRVSRTRGA